MAVKTTRDQRAQRWRIVGNLIIATAAITSYQLLSAPAPLAKVKAPAKNHFRAPAQKSSAPAEDVQPFAIAAGGSVSQQLLTLQVDPGDAQAASDAAAKAMGQIDTKVASSGRAVLQ